MSIPLCFIFISPTLLGMLVGILANLGEISKVDYILRPEGMQPNPEEDMDSVWQILFSWSVIGPVALALVGIGVGVMSVAHPPEFRAAQACFLIAAVMLTVRSAAWLIEINISMRQRAIAGFLVFGLIGGAWILAHTWVTSREGVAAITVSKNYQDPILLEIDEFITEKDEMQLRQEFDFPDMLTYNIRFIRRTLAPQTVSSAQSDAINQYFLGGQARLDVRYANVTTVNNRVQVAGLPGKIGSINTSVKYVNARRKLNGFISSAQVPADVADSLKQFDALIEKNSVLMLESLNESLALEPRFIFENESFGSPFLGSATGAYWQKFEYLSPKAEIVRQKLRSHLNGDK